MKELVLDQFYFNCTDELSNAPIQTRWFTLFTNNTTLAWCDKATNQLKGSIASDMGTVEIWCNKNSLFFNVEKTCKLTL